MSQLEKESKTVIQKGKPLVYSFFMDHIVFLRFEVKSKPEIELDIWTLVPAPNTSVTLAEFRSAIDDFLNTIRKDYSPDDMTVHFAESLRRDTAKDKEGLYIPGLEEIEILTKGHDNFCFDCSKEGLASLHRYLVERELVELVSY